MVKWSNLFVVKEIKEWNKTIKKFDKVVINPKIASQETIDKVKAVLENVVKRGTGSKLYSKIFQWPEKPELLRWAMRIRQTYIMHLLS
jgi:cell division protein FtsI/penicillin-binding protein 2